MRRCESWDARPWLNYGPWHVVWCFNPASKLVNGERLCAYHACWEAISFSYRLSVIGYRNPA